MSRQRTNQGAMRMNDILTFIAEARTTDAYGDQVITETTRQAFCRAESIGAKEFYQAAATGLKPEIKLVLADYLDYQGEKLLQYDGTRYHVLRTYRNGKELELTCYTEVNPSVAPAPTPTPTTEEGADD